MNDAKVNIEFYSPFSSRNYLVETKAGLDLQEWAEQDGVELGDLGNGDYKATFSKDQNANNFYRVVALDPPPVFFDDFEAGGEGWTHGGDEDNWEHGVPTTPDRVRRSAGTMFMRLDWGLISQHLRIRICAHQ